MTRAWLVGSAIIALLGVGRMAFALRRRTARTRKWFILEIVGPIVVVIASIAYLFILSNRPL
jgi:hypothetical protein